MNFQAANRLAAAQWLEWSGLPLKLNQARSGAWSVYKKIVELDCLAHVEPSPVEIAPEELAARCGLTLEQLEKSVTALRKQKTLKVFYPEHPQELGLFEILVPPPAPVAPEVVVRQMDQPLFRDISALRYATPIIAAPVDEQKLQQAVDWYLHHLSQKMNGFILEQIELAVRRFPLEAIHTMIERAARHNLRNFGWVLKELFREQGKESGRSGSRPIRNKS